MGFRTNAYCTVWSVKPISDAMTKINISTGKKNKQTDKFEKDFSDFAACVGTAVAKKALSLKEGDKIKLGDVEVTKSYGPDGKPTFTNYKIYSFEVEESSPNRAQKKSGYKKAQVGDGEIDNDVEDARLPF